MLAVGYPTACMGACDTKFDKFETNFSIGIYKCDIICYNAENEEILA